MTDPTARHVIIVVRIGEQLQGIIVDAVNDIVTVQSEDMQPLPDMGDTAAQQFLDGLATIDQRLILVLALERLVERAAMADAA
jgi:purine-binding chemotaxis protein CheW